MVGSQGSTRIDGRNRRACQEGGVYAVCDNQSKVVISSASQIHMLECGVSGQHLDNTGQGFRRFGGQ